MLRLKPSSFLLLLLLLSASCLAPTAHADTTTGLVGWWTFNGKDSTWTGPYTGTTADLSGNNNTGTFSGMGRATSTVVGKLGQAFSFNRTGAIKTSQILLSAAIPNGFSVFAWAKASSLLDAYVIEQGGSDGIVLNSTPGGIGGMNCELRRSDGTSFYTPNSTTNILQWHHYGCVFNQVTHNLTLYVDAASTTSVNVVGFDTIYNFDGRFYLGGRSYNSTGYVGMLDDVRIYDHNLSADDIRQIYKLGATKIATSPTGTSGTGLNSGLVGWWTFDGKDTIWTSPTAATTLDKSGNGNTGTLNSMTRGVSTVLGKIGQALKFDGVITNVNIGAAAINPPCTMSAWVNLSSRVPVSGSPILVYENGGGNYSGFRAEQYMSDNVGITIASVGDYVFTSPGYTVPLGKWTHLVAVIDSASSATLYANGVASGTISGASSLQCYRGTIGGSNSDWLPGSIDDVRVYNRALSAAEVTQLYKLGATKIATSPTGTSGTGLNAGLVGYWPFDGKNTTWTSATTGTTNDVSGNGNTGTLTNMNQRTSPVTGKIGQALNFNGSNSYINIGAPASLNDIELQGGGGMSGSAWIYLRSFSAAQPGIMAKDSVPAPGVGRWDFYVQNDRSLRFSKGYQTTELIAAGATGSSGVALNKWQYVTFTWDGSSSASNVKLYVNGVETSTYSIQQNGVGTKPTDSIYGLTVTDQSRVMDGKIDDVRLYNRVLSSTEIKQLYKLGASVRR